MKNIANFGFAIPLFLLISVYFFVRVNTAIRTQCIHLSSACFGHFGHH